LSGAFDLWEFNMGLFDFFRRKAQKPPGPSSEDLDEPRCHHYALAHYVLRSVAFDDPLAYLGILASPDAHKFLAHLLRSVSERCKNEQPDFAAEDIAIHPVRVGQYPCAVIELPQPRATAEAYFTAAVLLADLQDQVPESAQRKLRYFTLEKGFVLNGPPRTVLCEWTSEGSHVNYGDGPLPQLEAFVRAVEELLSRSRGI
jgi:hypothetical protein